jgi:DNA polymerase delta subunit 2
MLHPRKSTEAAMSKQFKEEKFEYGKQFAGIYWTRLETLRPSLASKIQNIPYVEKLFEISAGVRCGIIGTVYIEMKLKPNVLTEIENDVF